MTDAAIQFHPNPALAFEASFILVNRHCNEVVLDMSSTSPTSSVSAGATGADIVHTDLTPLRAAELLTATPVFSASDMPALRHLCTELCQERRISRKLCRAGAEVFQQGDVGDAVYVVESGKLEIRVMDYRRGRDRHLADLGPGEIVGEMAALGDGRRTATARAVEDTSLMVIHAEALKRLLQRCPAATTRLLSIMLERQAGLAEAA